MNKIFKNILIIFTIIFLVLVTDSVKAQNHIIGSQEKYKSTIMAYNYRQSLPYIESIDSINISSATVLPDTSGLSKGSIDLTVSGGLSPYTYLWSNGAVTQDITSLLQDITSLLQDTYLLLLRMIMDVDVQKKVFGLLVIIYLMLFIKNL